MVFETYTTHDYSFHYNDEYNISRPPKTHYDISYHRMQEQQQESSIQNINMGNILRNNKGEPYYEVAYSQMLPKTSSVSLLNTDKEKGNSIIDILKQWFCCG